MDEPDTTLSPVLAGRGAPTFDGVGRFLPGTVLVGRYRMIGLLGRGGMGEVYRADDLKLGQPVALKFLRADVERDADRLERFLNEVRTSLRVTHPNVCRVFDVGQIDQRHFLSMEYVDGEDLGSLLRRIGRLPEDKAVEIARQLCAGLAAAHDEGVLHRDIKPANIMIDGRGRAKITDFGLAGAVAGIEGHEARAGTPQYMAPEQIDGGALSQRTDLYALGLVLYELFTGKRPYDVNTIDELRRTRSSLPTSPSSLVSGLDPLVERAILRCLETDPARRPASASALAASLPGGDPLAMAIAAGDTPSPEMVAAAGADVGITARMATILLSLALVGLAALTLLAGRVAVYTVGAPVKPPDVLIERSRQILADAGGRSTVGDSAWGFTMNQPYVISPREHRANGPDAMARYGILFWYRERPFPLERELFVPPYLITTVWQFDPNPRYSGDSMVFLDREGRLVDFLAIAPQHPGRDPGAAGTVDWSVLFKAAGLDESTWADAEPEWVPLFYGDRRQAWVPRTPQPVPAVRIEAASFRGRPTSFSLIYPWTNAERDVGTSRSEEKRTGDAITILLLAALMLGSIVMARRNLRLDRADRKGALRLAVVAGGCVWLAWLFDEHHVASIWELYLAMAGAGLALLTGTLVAALYLALEPQVRRRWPSLLVSSSRLLAGDVFNPLVARDVLIGCAVAGVAYSLDLWGMLLALHVTGVLPLLETTPRPFLGGLHLATEATMVLVWTVLNSLFFLLLYYIARRLVRFEWAAVLVCALLLSVTGSGALGGGAIFIRLPFEFVFSAVMFVVLARVGVVALSALFFVMFLLLQCPVVWPMTAWYAPAGFVAIGLSAALVIGSYRIVMRAQGRA